MVDDPVPLGATQRHDFNNLGHILTSFSDLALEKLKDFLSNIYSQKQFIWLFWGSDTLFIVHLWPQGLSSWPA